MAMMTKQRKRRAYLSEILLFPHRQPLFHRDLILGAIADLWRVADDKLLLYAFYHVARQLENPYIDS